MDGAWGLIDLDWSQRTPIFHPDDIDRDPRFSQYPFQEGDDLDDTNEEEMEVESRLSGGAGDASMAPLSNTRRIYQCLPATYSFESAQTPGLPQSTHTDTDTTMEMGGLSVAPRGPGNASRDAWLPPHELCQPDQPLRVGHQPLTSWDTVPRPPKKKVNGCPILK